MMLISKYRSTKIVKAMNFNTKRSSGTAQRENQSHHPYCNAPAKLMIIRANPKFNAQFLLCGKV
ncbi:hypothetical protein ACJBU6_08619 [Exserohilum turcicum]